MAKAIIIIEDINLDDGTVRSEITIEGTAIDDGQVTAAHFFGLHIKDCMKDPVFLRAVWEKAAELMNETAGAKLLNEGSRPANLEVAQAA